MGIPVSEMSGSGATRELHETIKQQIASTDKQSKVIRCITVFMAFLAVVQTAATIVQIIPIVQSYQDRDANHKLCNPTGTFNKQESQLLVITHSNPPIPPPKPEAPNHSARTLQ